MGLRLLTSGGAGFIGSHLVDRLLQRADVRDLVVVDDLSSGSMANLAHIDDARLQMVKGDISTFQGAALFDEIYHLASPASPLAYMARPVETIAANVGGALCLLGQLAPAGRFCFTSTSEIYGDPDISPQAETTLGRTDPAGPRASYVEAKRCTEALVLHAAAVRGFDVRVARLFNCYGPRMGGDDGRAIPSFLAQALSGRPLIVHGDGQQRRSWGYIDDIIDALARFFWRDPMAHTGPLNIGNASEVSVIDIARHIASLVPGTTIAHGAALPDDPRHRCPDLTLCRALLPGWNADVDVHDGIARTLSWMHDGPGR